jgi:hypothetical protein
MVEWLRQTIFMTISLVDVNLMGLYYFFSVVVPYGFVALFIGCFIGLSSDQECQTAQMGRSTYLKLQFIPLFLYIPTCFAHIIFFAVKGVEWCHEIYLKEGDDEEEE